ncbi:MAG TPA: hypothetical protein VMP10_01305, partial [Chloroflexota bacterium]|nr:hypothetical protein [Chloroflexota bacterium]
KRSFTPPTPSRQLNYRVGDAIELIGVMKPESAARNQRLSITLYWHALATPLGANKVFVHLIDESGQPLAQRDQAPLGGSRETDGWVSGEYLIDTHELDLPPDLPVGNYQIAVGMYDPTTGVRLVAIGPDGRVPEDRILVGTVRIDR